MRFTLEFADSELRDVAREGDLVRLRFAAAAVRNESGERGWLTGVSLEMSAASLQGDTALAFGKIAEASLHAGSRPLRHVALPGVLEGEALRLSLRLANGTHFGVNGTRLEAKVADDARFTEDLSC